MRLENSKDEDTRYFHINENDRLDEELVTSWIRQASYHSGWLTADIGGNEDRLALVISAGSGWDRLLSS